MVIKMDKTPYMHFWNKDDVRVVEETSPVKSYFADPAELAKKYPTQKEKTPFLLGGWRLKDEKRRVVKNHG